MANGRPFLGRVGCLVGMAAFAAFSHFMIRGSAEILPQRTDETPNTWSDQLRYLAYVICVGVPLGLAVLTALGYDYTAQHLANRLQATISIVFAVMLGRAVVLRWLTVREFRLQQSIALTAEQAPSEEVQSVTSEGDNAPNTSCRR